MYALTEPIDEAALTAFIADSKTTGKPWRQITTGLPRPGVSDIIGQLIPVVVPIAGLLVLLSLGGASLVQAVWRFTFEAPFPLNLVVVGFLALIVVGVVIALVRVVKVIRSLIIPRSWWEAAYRITRFAAANGLRYGHDEHGLLPGRHLRHRDRPDGRAPAHHHGRPPGGDRQLPLHDRGGQPGELPGVRLGIRRDHSRPPAAAPAARREGQRQQRLRHP